MKIFLFLLILMTNDLYGQYKKEKIMEILCGSHKRGWIETAEISDLNSITLCKNFTAKVKMSRNFKIKWSLQTPDSIRWFINLPHLKYELILEDSANAQPYLIWGGSKLIPGE